MVCIKKGICGIFKKLEVISGSQIGVGWLETLSALCVPVTVHRFSDTIFLVFLFCGLGGILYIFSGNIVYAYFNVDMLIPFGSSLSSQCISIDQSFIADTCIPLEFYPC